MNERRRPYTLKRRAERQAETRRRIVEATSELHCTIGPTRTTVSAIAELAGVQRHTVYDHFPDELLLFQACGQHFAATHPPPDVTRWRSAEGGLRELYAYYEANAQAIELVLRDSALVPVGRGLLALQGAAAQALAPRPAALPVLRVVTAFATWRELTGSGLTSRAAARAMARLISSPDADRDRLRRARQPARAGGGAPRPRSGPA